jgi:hypothetical protein
MRRHDMTALVDHQPAADEAVGIFGRGARQTNKVGQRRRSTVENCGERSAGQWCRRRVGSSFTDERICSPRTRQPSVGVGYGVQVSHSVSMVIIQLSAAGRARSRQDKPSSML